ncbi:hypothetical protein KIN20_015126 [Parelaphostrongylus tenuis]|uniref:Uncharacterized protein n=1 Tax=Parelaphostrongylus tenuis TaxID=148309 RepID=A0AAD5QPM9_PARTN|nr:hypothetical protein KIN20_015126 [Parelaphostrongylus tenuis]
MVDVRERIKYNIYRTRVMCYTIAAGKNLTKTELNKEKLEFEATKGISWKPTPQDECTLEKALDNLKQRINFGVIPLDKSVNNLHIEVIYKKSKNAVIAEALKLFFDIEIDPPCAMK